MASTAEYCTVDQVREDIGKVNADRDHIIRRDIKAASRVIDRVCNRIEDGFVAPSTAVTREFVGSGTRVQWIDEAAAISLVEVKTSRDTATYTAWAATDWRPATGDPRTPDFNRTPYQLLLIPSGSDYSIFTGGRTARMNGFRPLPDDEELGWVEPTVRVTAKWGYALVVPDDISLACSIQVARWFKRGESSWADTLGNADTGIIMYRKKLDPDIQLILKDGRWIRPTAMAVR